MAVYIFYDSFSKMYLIYSTLCTIIAVLSYASGYVMLAANIEDVRSLADKYIPEHIADEIINRARADVIRDRHKQYEEDKANAVRGRHKINEEERATPYSYKHINQKYTTDVKKYNPHLRMNRRNDTKKTSYEMNLDDLVAKVKKRLQIELKLIEASADKRVQARYKKQSRHDAEEAIRQIDRLNQDNSNHKPQRQQSREDDPQNYYDRYHRPKIQQSRDDTEHNNQQIDRPAPHDYDHKRGTHQSKNDDRPVYQDRERRPEPQQSRDTNRPTFIVRNHKKKTQQSKDDYLPVFHDQMQQSREDDRPAHLGRIPQTDKIDYQNHRPQKHDFHTEQENQSPEQIKNPNSPVIKNNPNKKERTTESRERSTTEVSDLYEKVVLGKSKENSEKEEYVTSEIERQSPRYKSKTGKVINSFAKVETPTDENKYKVLSVFSDEEPITSKNKEGVYYYDETLNYDKKKNDNKNYEKSNMNSQKPVLQRDADNKEPIIEPYADQLGSALEKPADERETAHRPVLNEDNKKIEKVVIPNTKPRETNINRSVRKPSKATVIPKRDFYKISSPNYLLKMPIIGERYHFDEPIPEGDRVPENLKYIGNPPASINGKVILSQ